MDRAPDALAAPDLSSPIAAPLIGHPRTGDPALAARLAQHVEGEVLFDAASRGRYSTDASIYQIEPVGVVVAKTAEDVRVAMQIAAEEGIPVLPRGAGSSQCGQTVGVALVIDTSRHLNRVIEVDPEARTAIVEPGLVLDHLNAQLRKHKLWFPVDVSTSAQATLGGMAGNNSCGSRSIRYGNMVHNVLGVDALLADGREAFFGVMDRLDAVSRPIADHVLAIARREAAEIDARWPKVLRLVPGLEVKTVESSCCGMAGAFGYEAAHHAVSMKMAEAALLPAVRAASADTLVVADGTSCRHQIADGAAREALHLARVLAQAL